MIEHHDLRHEFPEHVDRIHELKMTDDQFRALFDQYHALDKEVRRIELDIQPTADEYLEERKRERVRLKDALYAMLEAG